MRAFHTCYRRDFATIPTCLLRHDVFLLEVFRDELAIRLAGLASGKSNDRLESVMLANIFEVTRVE